MSVNWKEVQQIFSATEFEIISTLGSGGFGTCYKAVYCDEEVCLKMINRTSKKKAALESFRAESNSEFYNFKHPNIVRLLASSQPVSLDDEAIISELLMVFEFIDGRNLQSILDDPNEVVETERMVKFGTEIGSALHYVHSFNIAHLDVKPANIMITRDGVCKLADFGCSQSTVDDTPARQSCLTGTFAYRAPELLCGGNPTSKCDVYALGICLWQFWSRVFPFSGLQQHVVVYQVVKSNLRPNFDLDKKVNPFYRDLATQCWSGDPARRPTMVEVVQTLRTLNRNQRFGAVKNWT